MSAQRRSYESGHKPKYLVVVDDSAEWDRAVYYASRRAIRVGGGIVMLRVVEPEDRNQEWLGVAEMMRAEAEEGADAALDRAAGRATAVPPITPERSIREGDMSNRTFDVIDKDVDIAMLGSRRPRSGRAWPDYDDHGQDRREISHPLHDRAWKPDRRGNRRTVLRA